MSFSSSLFEYVDVSNERKSEVWKSFLLNKEEEKARCIICNATLKVSGFSTGTLVSHLRSKHQITIKRKAASEGNKVIQLTYLFFSNK